MRLKHVKNADSIIQSGKYYIDNPKDYKGKWNLLFDNDFPIYLEIGTGKGDFLIANAIKYPNINFIGIEKYDSVIVRAIQKSNDLELSNLRFIRMDARFIEEIFGQEIDLIYLNFSDPWPKDRHAKRRLTSSFFLDKYQNIFKGSSHIIMKTDNQLLFDYSVESLKEYGYTILFESNDLYSTDLVIDNVPTEYEKKFVQRNMRIYYLEAVMNRKV